MLDQCFGIMTENNKMTYISHRVEEKSPFFLGRNQIFYDYCVRDFTTFIEHNVDIQKFHHNKINRRIDREYRMVTILYLCDQH